MEVGIFRRVACHKMSFPYAVYHCHMTGLSVTRAYKVRNEQYSLLAVMSELSTVWCDRVFGLWLQVHGRRVSTVSCRGGAVADGPCDGRR